MCWNLAEPTLSKHFNVIIPTLCNQTKEGRMGLFDSIFMAADLVKGGIAAFKASERLEELVGQANDYYEGSFTEENKALYVAFKKTSDALAATTDSDETSKLSDKKDEDAIAFLLSIAANPAISKKFGNEITEAIAEWNRANDLPMEIFEKRMMKAAKTDEERDMVRKFIDETKEEEGKK